MPTKSSKKRVKKPIISDIPAPTIDKDNVSHLLLRIVKNFVLFILIFTFGVVTALSLVIAAITIKYIQTVSQAAALSPIQLEQTIRTGLQTIVPTNDGKYNVLLLGTDALSNRDESHPLTDTIMVLSLQLQSGKITTFSFPRDLYIASEGAKINALYDLGTQKDLSNPTSLIRSTVEDISGLPMHRTVVIDIQVLGNLIDAIGGIDVNIERSFVDNQFPRMDVDVKTVHDPKKLYETVAFTAGTEHMTGNRALQYIRSRHSLDPIEGSDDARVRRQQVLIAALIKKFEDPTIVLHPQYIGTLLHIYNTTFESQIPMSEGIAIAKQLSKNGAQPTLVTYQVSIVPTQKDGLLYHPNTFPTGAWVYLPVDSTWKQMKTQILEWTN